LLSRITICPLPDVPDDDIWCKNLKCILPPWQGGIKGGLVPEVVLFTGNEWVRDICTRHDIQTDWISSYTIDISGTKIREMIRKGEDVSQWTKIELT
jgi:nicotinamide mononucleotide adenylyltransferase